MNEVDPTLVRELLRYDPDTGIFRWGPSAYARVRGKPAGTVSPTVGYRYIRVAGVKIPAARLAWVYMTGENPSGIVDHISRDKTDDRWINLRLANPTGNNANRKVQANSRSQVKGAQYEPRTGRYYSRIKAGGVSRHLGTYETPEEANDAYARAARVAFGEYACAG
jgi:hypothetical protein